MKKIVVLVLFSFVAVAVFARGGCNLATRLGSGVDFEISWRMSDEKRVARERFPPPCQKCPVKELIDCGREAAKHGDFKLAREYFERAVIVDIVNVEAHYCLGLTYVRLGNYEAARAEYNIILSLISAAQEKARVLAQNFGGFDESDR